MSAGSSITADVVVIVPLLEEFTEILAVIPFVEIPKDKHSALLPSLYEAEVGGLRVVACVVLEMANEISSVIADRCINLLEPSLVVGIGIAGGLHKDARLGDVVFSRTVDACVFESKAVADKGGYRLQPSANGSTTIDHLLFQYANMLSVARHDEFAAWQADGKAHREKLGLETSMPKRPVTPRRRGAAAPKAGPNGTGKADKESIVVAGDTPALHVKAIASGPSVGAAAAYVAEIKTIGRDFFALEMEGAGIAFAATKRPERMSFFLLRGISDFSDDRKAELEESTDGNWRRLAVANAARLLVLMLKDPRLMALARASRGRAPASTVPGKPTVRVAVIWNDTVHYVSSISDAFRTELRARLKDMEVFFSERVGSPEFADRESNETKIRQLVNSFGNDSADYVVTIGTAVTLAALRALHRRDRLLFLGVSDPEALALHQHDRASRPLITGVRYGLPIDQTISIIKQVFPGRTPVFVCSADRYPQDSALRDLVTRDHAAGVEVLDLPAPQRLEGADSKVFFGRFFFCSNMAEFARQNADAPLVGVSKHNVGFGATLAVGYEPEQIGRFGAEEMAKDLTSSDKFVDGRILHPSAAVLAVNRSSLARFGARVPALGRDFEIFDVR